MHYVLLTELESIGSTSCKLKGLPPSEMAVLESALTALHIRSMVTDEFFEADTHAVQILNLLSSAHYKVQGQSMVIEKTNIGGRTVQVQKTIWTLGND